MRVDVICPRCYKRDRFQLDQAPERVVCRRCHHERSVKVPPGMVDERVVKICPMCGMGYFYVEKDFPAAIGCLVMLGAIGLFLYFNLKIWALAFLMGAAAFDFLVYYLAKNRTICYKCLSEFRGFRDNPEHQGFDLGIGSRFSDEQDGRGLRPPPDAGRDDAK